MNELLRIASEGRQSLAIGLGTTEIMLILGVIILLFGGRKIPELMRGVGKGVGELQKGLEEGKRAIHTTMHEDEEVVTPKITPAEKSVAHTE